jgi:hypothetical protein
MEQGGLEPIHSEWEQRVADLWAAFGDHGADEFLARMDQLVAELPAGSPAGAFERAGALDATDHCDEAVPLYRQALGAGWRAGAAARP